MRSKLLILKAKFEVAGEKADLQSGSSKLFQNLRTDSVSVTQNSLVTVEIKDRISSYEQKSILTAKEA
jgi:hypothetical protein